MKNITELTVEELKKLYWDDAGGRISHFSKICNVSDATAKKVLIDRGIIETDLSVKIKALMAQGLSQKEIAKKLGETPANITRNAPYERPSYLKEEKSKDAIDSKKWRDRKK